MTCRIVDKFILLSFGDKICCIHLFIYLFLFFCSVVRFRRTGESTRSEEDIESREQDARLAEQTDLEAVAVAEGPPVPREFANPTDGIV